jgi:hypothetical protein
MQMHGYEHTSYPDDYGFSKDNHIHHHMDMEKPKTQEYKHDNL